MNRTKLILAALALLLGSTEHARADMIFYGEAGIPTSIGVSATDGTGYTSVISNAGFVEGFAIDSAGGKIYWADATNPGGTNALYRANLDGTGQQILDTTTAGINGVGLDLNAGKVYFGGDDYTLYQANLDGSNKTKILSGDFIGQVQVDGGKVYWSDVYGIESANLDGSDIQSLVTGQSSIVGLDVVGSLGKMFWADQSTGLVQSANLDGSDVTVIGSGYYGARGVAVDTATDRVYWGAGGQIYSANLDGSNVSSYAAPSNVLSLEIVPGPSTATPEPSSLTLLGIGTAGLIGYGWRRRRRST